MAMIDDSYFIISGSFGYVAHFSAHFAHILPSPAHHHIEIKPKIWHQIIPHLATEEMKMEQFFFSRFRFTELKTSLPLLLQEISHLLILIICQLILFFYRDSSADPLAPEHIYPPSRAQNLPTEKDFIM